MSLCVTSERVFVFVSKSRKQNKAKQTKSRRSSLPRFASVPPTPFLVGRAAPPAHRSLPLCQPTQPLDLCREQGKRRHESRSQSASETQRMTHSERCDVPARAGDDTRATETCPADARQKEGHYLKVLIAGGISGAISRTGTAPLDRIKVLSLSLELSLSLSLLNSLSLLDSLSFSLSLLNSLSLSLLIA